MILITIVDRAFRGIINKLVLISQWIIVFGYILD